MSKDSNDEKNAAATNSSEPNVALADAVEPEHARLIEAQHAFEVGDYRRVRQITDILREAHTDTIAKEAADLRRRVSTDPAQIAVLLGCVALLLALVYIYVPL